MHNTKQMALRPIELRISSFIFKERFNYDIKKIQCKTNAIMHGQSTRTLRFNFICGNKESFGNEQTKYTNVTNTQTVLIRANRGEETGFTSSEINVSLRLA